MTSKDWTAARDGSRRQPGRLSSGLGSETRVRRRHHFFLVLVEASGIATAVGAPAAPADLTADQGLLKGHLLSLVSSDALAGHLATLSLRPGQVPSLTPLGPLANQASSTYPQMAIASKWLSVSAGQWLALAEYTIAHFMSGSFVHRSIIAGCRYSHGYLRSGPREEGRYANH
jgi:hypothetical protein